MSQHTEFEINEDLTDVKEFGGGDFAPALPIGDYVFDVVDISQGTSKAQMAKVEVVFEVVEGDYQGARITNNYSLSKKALGRIKSLQLACGARVDKIRSNEILGARIRASVVHNEGTPMTGADGTPMPVRVFANIVNERPLEDAVAAPEPVAPPPVTRKASNGAAATRRA